MSREPSHETISVEQHEQLWIEYHLNIKCLSLVWEGEVVYWIHWSVGVGDDIASCYGTNLIPFHRRNSIKNKIENSFSFQSYTCFFSQETKNAFPWHPNCANSSILHYVGSPISIIMFGVYVMPVRKYFSIKYFDYFQHNPIKSPIWSYSKQRNMWKMVMSDGFEWVQCTAAQGFFFTKRNGLSWILSVNLSLSYVWLSYLYIWLRPWM